MTCNNNDNNNDNAQPGLQSRRPTRTDDALPTPTPPHILALPSQVHGCVAGNRSTIYVVRRKDLLHVPRTPEYSLAAYRRHFVLTLCPAFATHGDCTAGSQCRQAHARIRGTFGRFTPHFVPDDPDRVPAAERFPDDLPAVRVGLACQPPTAPSTLVRPGDCYTTRARILPMPLAGEAPRAGPAMAPSHCKHWLQAGLCHYGATCRFVHALNPEAAQSLAAGPASSRMAPQQPQHAHPSNSNRRRSGSDTDTDAPFDKFDAYTGAYQHDPYAALPLPDAPSRRPS